VPLLIAQTGSDASPAAPAPSGVREPTALPPRGYFPAWQLAADRITTGSTPAQADAEVTQSAVPTSAPTTPATTAPAPTTTAPAPTTTSTAPPAPPTTVTAPPVTAAAAASAQRVGVVTYYADPGGPGTCASPGLPFGTVVTITNPANGATVQCRVNDREADTARQIDLDTASFAQIAPLSQGVIYAELSW
jgi:hypothetical protein